MSLITRITPALVRAWRPCSRYTDAARADYIDLDAIIPGGITPYDLADRRRVRAVPVADRLWALRHVIPDREMRLLACTWAERALRRDRRAGREPDPRSWAAVAVSRRFAAGDATVGERAAAWDAAGAAAWAAWDAAWTAVGGAKAAARDAAKAAAWAAAATEVRQQLRDVRRVLEASR